MNTTDRELKTYDTKMSVIEKKYGLDFGVSDDMSLGDFLRSIGYPSLADMLIKQEKAPPITDEA